MGAGDIVKVGEDLLAKSTRQYSQQKRPVYRLLRSYPHFLHRVIYKKGRLTHEKVLFNLYRKCYYNLSTESGSGRSAFYFRLLR